MQLSDSDVSRLVSKIAHSDDGCWEWIAGKDARGYGAINIRGRMVKAHRVAYEFYTGCVLDGDTHIDHTCSNRGCVNPAHLDPVSQGENTRRTVHRDRHKKCRRLGHEGGVIKSTGYYRCRTCNAARQRMYNAKRGA